jgi:hypothetical protein
MNRDRMRLLLTPLRNDRSMPLKVVGNEKEGVRKVANDRNWSRTAAIDVLLAVNLAVVFILMYFRFRQVNQNY